MRNHPILIGAALLSAIAIPVASQAQSLPAAAWEIGPVIRGKNYSVGMPLSPTPSRQGWSFEFPYPHVGAGHVHYLTSRQGPLVGASRIVMRYRIEAARGARFVPREHPDLPGAISFFFQRAGDSWSGKRHEYHRWYAPTVTPLRAGVHEVSVRLDDPNWISVFGKPASSNPRAFGDALAQTDRVGFVFGSSATRGHGVYATAPARFTLLAFEIR